MMFLFDCKDTIYFLNGITFAVINFWLFLAFVKKSKSQKSHLKGTRGQGDRKVFRLVQTDKEGQTKLIYIIYIL